MFVAYMLTEGTVQSVPLVPPRSRSPHYSIWHEGHGWYELRRVSKSGAEILRRGDAGSDARNELRDIRVGAAQRLLSTPPADCDSAVTFGRDENPTAVPRWDLYLNDYREGAIRG